MVFGNKIKICQIIKERKLNLGTSSLSRRQFLCGTYKISSRQIEGAGHVVEVGKEANI